MIEKYLLALAILATVHKDPASFGKAALEKISRWSASHELTDSQIDQLYEVVGRYLWDQIP